MKIYFAGSITAGRDDAELYGYIIEYLCNYGKVLTEHLGLKSLTSMGEVGKSDEFVFKRDVAWVEEADLIVAEVTTPSLGVGYEIGIAEKLGKKIICLYRPQTAKRLSKMITGNNFINVIEYKDIDDLKHKLNILN